MSINLTSLIIYIIINILFISPSLWLSGRALVGKKKAKFTDSILIVILGTVIGVLVGAFFTGFLSIIIQLILWLLTIKHFFDCGWLKALAISIFAIIVFILISIVLGFIGIALIFWL
jgi:hypothetical protein